MNIRGLIRFASKGREVSRPGYNVIRQVVRNVRTLLSRRENLAYGSVSDAERQRDVSQKLEGALEQVLEQRMMLTDKDREIERLKAELSASRHIVENGYINPENIIWIFGSGRTGSNWLLRMMREITNCAAWQEPRVGVLFDFYYRNSAHHTNKHFVFGSPYRETWLRSIRSFVLEGATARFPEIVQDGHLIVREPTGSSGAPLLMEALPESRMILLIRDPRDVVASLLDGARKGGWLYERGSEDSWKQLYAKADSDPNAFVKKRSKMFSLHAGRAKQAYDAHKGHKVLLKYEDLRFDPVGTMKRLYDTLEVPADEETIARAVHQHSWESIPEEDKGEGKFHRKATPEGWREDLTAEQVKIVEEITAPLLNEFYSNLEYSKLED